MERALQERVIGAAVLVIFIVLVVPVFLDGPATDDAVISEAVVLPGQNGQQRKRQTIVLERDRSDPVPQRQAPDSEGRADSAPSPSVKAPATKVPEQPAPTVKKEPPPQSPPTPAPKQLQQSATATVVAPVSSMWAVQLGSFSKKDNAERLAANLRQKGYAAFISQLESSGGPLHRVRVGPQKDRGSAEAVVARLATDGQNGQVVPHP